jgi:hypothetical protein
MCPSQLDGIPIEMLAQAMLRSHTARSAVLDIMAEGIAAVPSLHCCHSVLWSNRCCGCGARAQGAAKRVEELRAAVQDDGHAAATQGASDWHGRIQYQAHHVRDRRAGGGVCSRLLWRCPPA